MSYFNSDDLSLGINSITANVLSANSVVYSANGVSILTGIPGTYSNSNVAGYLVANPPPGTYSNANVTAYLPTYTGNITAGNIVTTSTGSFTMGNIKITDQTITGIVPGRHVNVAVSGTGASFWFNSNVNPTADRVYTLGSTTKRWAAFYCSAHSLDVDGILLEADTDIGGGNLIVSNATGFIAPNITSNVSVRDQNGDLRSIPINTQSTNYTLTARDSGNVVSISSGNVTVPASVFTAPFGQTVSVFNNSGTTRYVIQGTAVTLRLAGTAATGNRAMAQYGVTTLMCVAANTFVISGAGIS